MININFYAGIAIYTGLTLCAVLLCWLLARSKGKQWDLSVKDRYIWFCAVCAYTYINTREDIISTCPRCGSYNKKEIC